MNEADPVRRNSNSLILEIQGLGKHFSEFEISDVTFSLEKGYVMGLIGPNGSGKTTTIKLIMNLLKKDRGEVKVFGLDHVKDEKEIKNKIGFVYDENHYYGVLTIEQMKKIVAPMYQYWDERLFQKYLKDFGLNPKQKIDKLSKGMKTKFSLAMALSHHAELIILDEPTSGLDPVFRNELLEILYSLMQDENKAILFSTHITSDLERIADYITFINQGRVVFTSEKDQVLERFSLVKGPNYLLESSLEKQFIGLRKSSVGFEGLTADLEVILPALKEKIIVERPTLDEIMIYLVNRTGMGVT
ncbi:MULTISPECIES: ABC transporter ATP-binding protein [unclassified Dehalobacter]|uniref:ABC transporter ATP-binding protein n=1 Tax=unclassified Dehalobacter TaxID=2635733 RepID=UPI00037412D6|nr:MULTISPECIES: ABC transporter ATP-binding protein [unclassified Dehalobacter]TCX48780.1 sodium ABC transporter ATP-binding protein [Dehalobacter sp. 14DCB1]TCX56172.1 sodium ABC transporter ATP-binding protein [Dehalobacter sp. 12DCB1]